MHLLQQYLVRLSLLLVTMAVEPVIAAGNAEVSMDVEARIHSSIHMEWKKIDASDERYREMNGKLGKSYALGKEGGELILLPHGLFVELLTNDENRMVSLRVENLVSLDSKEKIPAERLNLSLNGGKLQSVDGDFPLLHPEDRGVLKEVVLLFVLDAIPTDRSGRYAASFQFITHSLP